MRKTQHLLGIKSLTERDLPFKISKGHKGINNRRHESSVGCLNTERFSMGYLVLFVISVCFAGLLYFMASKRGVNKSFWAIMGFFFGPFAIPFLFLAKKVDPTNTT